MVRNKNIPLDLKRSHSCITAYFDSIAVFYLNQFVCQELKFNKFKEKEMGQSMNWLMH